LRSFTDLDALIGMVPSQVVTRLSAIDFGRGSEALYRDQMPGLLTEHVLRHASATFRLADLRTAVPGVSDQTIRLVLEQLRGEGKVRADGTGRSATWTRTGNTAPSE
jgi:hypothetical protein